MFKKIIIVFLALLNMGLLSLIMISIITGWRYSFLKSENDIVADDSSTASDISQKSEFFSAVSLDTESKPDISKPDSEETSLRFSDNEPPERTESFSSQSGESAISETSELSVQSSQPVYSNPESKSSESESSSLYYPKNMNTDEKAGIRDAEGFSWENGWTYLSTDAEQITDFSAVTGGWKAVIISDPFELRNSYTTDYMNIHISGTAAKLDVTMNWGIRFFNSDGTSIDASGYPSALSGSYSDYTLTATGSGKLVITAFFKDNGKEYAVGNYTWPDGIVAYVGLIRP